MPAIYPAPNPILTRTILHEMSAGKIPANLQVVGKNGGIQSISTLISQGLIDPSQPCSTLTFANPSVYSGA